jgi:hypothetical protein
MNTIIYCNLKSTFKANHMQNAIVTKMVKLYVNYHINPLFDKHNSAHLQKPNPHVGMKKKKK